MWQGKALEAYSSAWHLGLAMKYLYEYYAEDRFRGQTLTLSIGYQF